MGEEAEYLSDWGDEVSHELHRRPERVRFAPVAPSPPPGSSITVSDGTRIHSPENDDQAKALIMRLDHYEWETIQVRGRFDRNPYSLSATINGVKHVIKIKGRFGGVMKWLDRKERAIAEGTQNRD